MAFVNYRFKSGVPESIAPGIRSVESGGVISLDLSPENTAGPSREESLKLYEKIINLCYEDASDIESNIAAFQVDRARQALYWTGSDGKRIFLLPRKGASGRIQFVETWMQ